MLRENIILNTDKKKKKDKKNRMNLRKETIDERTLFEKRVTDECVHSWLNVLNVEFCFFFFSYSSRLIYVFFFLVFIYFINFFFCCVQRLLLIIIHDEK